MPIVNTGLLSQTFAALGATSLIGYLCYKSIEGKDEDMYRNQHLGIKPKDTSKYDEKALLIETLKRGGAADLREALKN